MRSDKDNGRVSRRVFVVGLTGLVTAGPAALTAAAQTPDPTPDQTPTNFDRAAGVAVLGHGRAVALCQTTTRWVLVAADGVRDTHGLDGATVHAVTSDRHGLLAAGTAGGGAGAGVLWGSADGIGWQEVLRLAGPAEFSAIASAPGGALALGSLLSGEGTPKATVAARRTGQGWRISQVSGLGGTDRQAVTALSGERGAWVATSVGADGTTVFGSPDGTVWSEVDRLADAAVRSLLVDADGTRWVGNTMGGAGAVTGVVGGDRVEVAVRQDAHAVGAVRSGTADVSYWLADGALVTAELRRAS